MTDPVHKLLDSADLEPATERAYLTDGERSRPGATSEDGRRCQPILP
jgi:hypothetical protein